MTRLARLTDAMVKDAVDVLDRIAPSVLAATAEELLSHGWGDTRRSRIPADWRERPGPDAERKGRAKRG